MTFITIALNRWVQVAFLILAVGFQTVRLENAKHDLTGARAALHNPLTRNTWQADYRTAATERSAAGIFAMTQAVSMISLDTQLGRQSASLMAAGRAAAAARRATEESDRRASQAAVATDRTIAQLRAEAAAARARHEELCVAALRIGRGR